MRLVFPFTTSLQVVAATAGFFIVLIIQPKDCGAQNLTLTPAMSASVGRVPEALTVGDFNVDGHLDVATVNARSDDVTLLLGNGNGTFQGPTSFSVGENPMFLAAGDLNADHIPDLAVVSTANDSLHILLGKGEGTFQASKMYQTGKGPTFLALEDVDQDQDLDIVIVNSGWLGHYPPFSIAVFRNRGDGQFGMPSMYEQKDRDGMFPTQVFMEDFTNDGYPDLAISWSPPGWSSPKGLISVLINRQNGSFMLTDEIQAGSKLTAVSGADLDADGDEDLVVTSTYTDTVGVLLREQDGAFGDPDFYEVGFSPASLALGDLDRDGILDIGVANRASNSVSVLLGNENGTFRHAGHFAVGRTPTGLILEDFNGDRHADLLVSNSGSDDVSVLLSGKVEIPSITLSTESMVFKKGAVESEEEPQVLVLSNVGLGPLTVSKVELGGMAPDAFEIVDQHCLGNTLATGELCKLIVTFTSKTPGLHQAEMTIWDNAPGGPRSVMLTGNVRG